MHSFINRLLLSAVLCAIVAVQASAQDTSRNQDVRPAITSFWGDTGLWFVPSAEVLKPGGWAFGAYRTEQDFKQGATDVSYYPGTLAVGAGDRTEIFGAVRAVTSIKRNRTPLFAPATAAISVRRSQNQPGLRASSSADGGGAARYGEAADGR
jgi:hypothetical protein